MNVCLVNDVTARVILGMFHTAAYFAPPVNAVVFYCVCPKSVLKKSQVAKRLSIRRIIAR